MPSAKRSRGRIERFRVKRFLGLDPRMDVGSREECASKQKLERVFDSIKNGKVQADGAICTRLIHKVYNAAFLRVRTPAIPGDPIECAVIESLHCSGT